MAFRLRSKAASDIADIALHIAADSPAAAARWYDAILERCRKLGDSPGMGAAHPEVRPGLRMFPVGNYLILYREIDDGAEIVRVVHGARRWRELL